ncbi:MAG: 2-amino-4-hydroxy-6-hydroxymethyldihydropteridine diphosphokinase [Deltaproteobacteria bacterium]|nr:2-amino-4-hydroxy-6-hydroxymethyldihydropteridine diphosphokinase [Deltaproteobacteria bacterium]
MTNTAYISAGSNLGDRIENIQRGAGALTRSGDVDIRARAGYYSTAPMDYADQPWFVNTAFAITTRLSPDMLLLHLKKAEQVMGRKTGGIRFGPRILDFDIIFYNDLIIDTRKLVIPHPRMHRRGFVLHPLSDICPDFVHPVLGMTVNTLLSGLDESSGECVPLDENEVITKTAYCGCL